MWPFKKTSQAESDGAKEELCYTCAVLMRLKCIKQRGWKMLVKMNPRWGKLNPWLSSPARRYVPTSASPKQFAAAFLARSSLQEAFNAHAARDGASKPSARMLSDLHWSSGTWSAGGHGDLSPTAGSGHKKHLFWSNLGTLLLLKATEFKIKWDEKTCTVRYNQDHWNKYCFPLNFKPGVLQTALTKWMASLSCIFGGKNSCLMTFWNQRNNWLISMIPCSQRFFGWNKCMSVF